MVFKRKTSYPFEPFDESLYFDPPDWKDPSSYPAAEELTLAQWAWEFLRRKYEYNRDIDIYYFFKRHLKRYPAPDRKVHELIKQVFWKSFDEDGVWRDASPLDNDCVLEWDHEKVDALKMLWEAVHCINRDSDFSFRPWSDNAIYALGYQGLSIYARHKRAHFVFVDRLKLHFDI